MSVILIGLKTLAHPLKKRICFARLGGCRRFGMGNHVFYCQKYDELLQNNDNVLCREAKLFLLNFKEMKETKQPSEVVSKLQCGN